MDNPSDRPRTPQTLHNLSAIVICIQPSPLIPEGELEIAQLLKRFILEKSTQIFRFPIAGFYIIALLSVERE